MFNYMQGKYWVCLLLLWCSLFGGLLCHLLGRGLFGRGLLLGSSLLLGWSLSLGLGWSLAFLALGFLALAGLALGSLAGSLKDPAPFLPAAAAATIALEVTSFLRAILTRPPALAASTL